MQSKIYQVTAPEKIGVKEVEINDIPEGYVLVKTLFTGICQSDLRYFFGRRDPEVLKKKYPICLLHEGIAVVVEDSGNLKKGDKVVVIPNIPCYIHSGEKCEVCSKNLGENYCHDVRFMSSNCDGMCQTYFIQPSECVAKIPKSINDEAAALTELLTVAYEAIKQAEIYERDKVIIFGCGPTGYILSALLHFVFKIRKDNLYVIDVKDERLEHAKQFATIVNPGKARMPDIAFDKAFDCVGGNKSELSIDNAIGLLKPRGMVILLGVSENKIPIDTRKILDKGLVIKGTTRSQRQDYPIVLDFLKNEDFQGALMNIICKERFKADSAEDLAKALKEADDPEHYGKVLIRWD